MFFLTVNVGIMKCLKDVCYTRILYVTLHFSDEESKSEKRLEEDQISWPEARLFSTAFPKSKQEDTDTPDRKYWKGKVIITPVALVLSTFHIRMLKRLVLIDQKLAGKL